MLTLTDVWRKKSPLLLPLHIAGLTGNPQYNGCTAKIIGPKCLSGSEARYPIELLDGNDAGKAMRIKLSNLHA